MTKPSILDCCDYKTYLEQVTRRIVTRRKRPLSSAQWARRLEYRSPRSVAMVFSGYRLPSGEMIQRLSKMLGHSPLEHRYFELLVRLERGKRRNADIRPLQVELNRLSAKPPTPVLLDSDKFSAIANWHHLVLRQLAHTPSFREESKYLRGRLRNKVSETEIASAIHAMVELGIFRRDNNDRLSLAQESLSTTTDIPDRAIRRHHRQMLQRASESLSEQDVAQREMTSLTLRVAPERMGDIKAAIRRFRDRFHLQFESADSDDVAQLNVQFFWHTETTKHRESAR